MELNTSILPAEDVDRNSAPVKVEGFWLSKDYKSLQGSVAVANLAYHKLDTCRFTLDHWVTTSEVAAEYTGRVHGTGNDRWTFAIGLPDMANLETKTIYLYIRYNFCGHEFWDNNRGANFRVGFNKKLLHANTGMAPHLKLVGWVSHQLSTFQSLDEYWMKHIHSAVRMGHI